MRPLFTDAEFLKSATGRGDLPDASMPEIAFAGRSNAGKSSALNVLTAQRQLARVSKTPGRTQLLNYFHCERVRLVDLPGYGYAKVPEAMRRDWGRMVGDFLTRRENLIGVVIVMDIRHPLTDIDRQMLGWAQTAGKRVLILLTKADKFGFGRAKAQLLSVQRALAGGPTVELCMFSALKRSGVDELRERLGSWLPEPTDPPAEA